MADDTSYSTFLTKANADPKSGVDPDTHDGENQPNPHAATTQDSKRQATSEARSRYDPSESNNESIPAPLRNLPNVQYISDTESDFKPVFLSYSSHELPDVNAFKQVLAKQGKGDDTEVELLQIQDFDPRGEYKEIVQRVTEVGSGGEKEKKSRTEDGVVVFRVQGRGARVEYYVLTVGDRKLVGVVAEAVES